MRQAKIEKRDGTRGGISSVDNVRTAEYLLDDVEKNLGQMLPDVFAYPTFKRDVAPLCTLSFAS